MAHLLSICRKYCLVYQFLSFLPVCLCFFVLFLSPFPSLAISTKPSSLSLVLSLCLNTLQSTHLGGCYWSSCILLPGNPFPLSQSVAVIAEGIRGGGVGGMQGGGQGVDGEGENKRGVRKEAESV